MNPIDKHKNIISIISINLLLSLLVVYLSPRFDILTLLGFLLINIILFALYINDSRQKRKLIEEKIDDLFTLLHSKDIDSSNYELIDDEFAKLGDEIIKIIIENNRIADNAEKNKDILREYTEDIAHQIKTPLTGSLLLIDLLEEDCDEISKEYITRLKENLLRLRNLSDVLLKLAALDSATIEMSKDRICARDLVYEVIVNIKDYFIKENIDIPINGEDFFLVCDKKWTYEAVFNIVKNAIEASKNKNVKIYFKETNLYKSIFVEDSSPGMDKKMLEKVLKRFYKANPKSKGYGIGLPMAKSVMERQNGELLYHKGKKSNAFELRFYN